MSMMSVLSIDLAHTLLPLWWTLGYAFGLGCIIGSFLNVLIYRFHTGKSLAGHSHCLSCGTRLQWFELLPLVSYLGLRGRCRTCGCHIPSRYFLVELATGLAFLMILLHTTILGTAVLLAGIMAILIVITVYDLVHFIIPDELTAGLTLVVGALLALNVYLGQTSVDEVLFTVVAALGGAAFFFSLWFISGGAWLGFGDVKLAVPLGLLVGGPFVFSFVVAAFWIGAVVSVLIIAAQYVNRGKVFYPGSRRALTMKSAVPFAPFLVASSVLVYFTQFNVLSLFSVL